MNIKSARRGVTREKGKEGLLGTVGEWGQLGKEEVLFIEVVISSNIKFTIDLTQGRGETGRTRRQTLEQRQGRE